jgi:hypothetical protein
MDLTSIIREKRKSLPAGFNLDGLNAVLEHLARAEDYWNRARRDADEGLFTDVIYRTNQAFEGILKEAYSVLTNKDASRTTPHAIEEYLASSSVLKERVMAAFNNYRTEWRNKSTHDYKLFFSEQEALLAINSVSSFCVILLDQIIIKSVELAEKERVKRLADAVKQGIQDYESLDPYRKVVSLLVASYGRLQFPADRHLGTTEAIGLLSGFLEAVEPGIKVESEVSLGGTRDMRADLVVTLGGDKIILETKRTTSLEKSKLNESQVFSYMKLAETRFGILMQIDDQAKEGESSTLNTLFDEGDVFTYVFPKRA